MADMKPLDVPTEETVAAQEENEYFIEFKRDYVFEGKTYKSVDLSGLETKLTGDDYNEICGQLTLNERAVPETCPKFAFLAASLVTDLPFEFFAGLPAREASNIKNAVAEYFFG